MASSSPAPHPASEEERAGLARLLEDPLQTSATSRDERLAWGVTVAAMLAAQSRLEASLHRECGVTPFEYHLLMVLLGEDGDPESGEVAMSVAATRVSSSLSRLSHVVRRLEARGWLARRPSATDARVTLVRLTSEGLERAVRCSAVYTRLVGEIWVQHLDETDVRDAARVSAKVLAGLREDHWILPLASEASADADARRSAGPGPRAGS